MVTIRRRIRTKIILFENKSEKSEKKKSEKKTKKMGPSCYDELKNPYE